MARKRPHEIPLHPGVIRLTHWVNAIALAIMVASGLRIYLASPIFDIAIPRWPLLGGWLAGARMWHFFGMWLFAINGLVWAGYNIATRHGRQTTIFRWRDIRNIIPSIMTHLKFRRTAAGEEKYNALQKCAYTVVALLGCGSLASGIAIYWPVQASWLAACFGGFDNARVWHFAFMCALLLFIPGHLFMVSISGKDLFLSFLTGKSKRPTNPAA